MFEILYEDDHLLCVNKTSYDPVQPDKSGQPSMLEALRKTYPHADLPHRVDRPVTGIVLIAKRPSAMRALSALFADRKIEKIYWAITSVAPPKETDTLEQHLTFDRRTNKSFVHAQPVKDSQTAALRYKVIGKSDRYFFLQVELLTGRHHQIRAQLAAMGCPIRGDLKYGAPRSNPGGGISLHAAAISFVHPFTHKRLSLQAAPPEDVLWNLFPKS